MKITEPTLIVITGPTASGKSALAIDIAKRLGTEIISADSRQIYKGIPIVTALPSKEELSEVPHHLLNMLSLDTYYSAAKFEQDALPLVKKLIDKNGVAVVCGGSMMYIDALCNGIDLLPTIPDEIRSGLTKELGLYGIEHLRQELKASDPEYYAKVDLNNTKRVVHALEIIRATGKPYTELRTGNRRALPYKVIKVMITMPREILFERINTRVDKMIEQGLETEAQSVYHLRHLNSLNTVGLKEMFTYFDGKMDRHTAIERIKKNTRVYAKKQMTWWAKDPDIIPLDLNDAPSEWLISQVVRQNGF